METTPFGIQNSFSKWSHLFNKHLTPRRNYQGECEWTYFIPFLQSLWDLLQAEYSNLDWEHRLRCICHTFLVPEFGQIKCFYALCHSVSKPAVIHTLEIPAMPSITNTFFKNRWVNKSILPKLNISLTGINVYKKITLNQKQFTF